MLHCVLKGNGLAKGGDFSGKNFETRLYRPLQSTFLSEASSAPVVDGWSHKLPGLGSIPGMMPNSPGRLAQNMKNFFLHFFHSS